MQQDRDLKQQQLKQSKSNNKRRQSSGATLRKQQRLMHSFLGGKSNDFEAPDVIVIDNSPEPAQIKPELIVIEDEHDASLFQLNLIEDRIHVEKAKSKELAAALVGCSEGRQMASIFSRTKKQARTVSSQISKSFATVKCFPVTSLAPFPDLSHVNHVRMAGAFTFQHPPIELLPPPSSLWSYSMSSEQKLIMTPRLRIRSDDMQNYLSARHNELIDTAPFSAILQKSRGSAETTPLWQKYRPRTPSELVLSTKDQKKVAVLTDWLESFKKRQEISESTDDEDISSDDDFYNCGPKQRIQLNNMTDASSLIFGRDDSFQTPRQLAKYMPNLLGLNAVIIHSAGPLCKSSLVTSLLRSAHFNIIEIGPNQKRDAVTLSSLVHESSRSHHINKSANDNRLSALFLEEVDNIWEDDGDSGFWKYALSLSQHSKRPIFMTCNDLTALPVQVAKAIASMRIGFMSFDGVESDDLAAYLCFIAYSERVHLNSESARIILQTNSFRAALNEIEFMSRIRHNQLFDERYAVFDKKLRFVPCIDDSDLLDSFVMYPSVQEGDFTDKPLTFDDIINDSAMSCIDAKCFSQHCIPIQTPVSTDTLWKFMDTRSVYINKKQSNIFDLPYVHQMLKHHHYIESENLQEFVTRRNVRANRRQKLRPYFWELEMADEVKLLKQLKVQQTI